MNPSIDFLIEVRKDGNKISATPEGEKLLASAKANHDLDLGGGSLVTTTLNSGEQLEFQVDLATLYRIHQPGRYLVIARRVLWIDDAHPIGVGTSTSFVLGPESNPEPMKLVFPKLLDGETRKF